MSPEDEPCPHEQIVPDGAPGAVRDDEWVIRFVPSRDWLMWDDNARPVLRSAAFPRDELAGREGKSVSLLRQITPDVAVKQRGKFLNKEDSWRDDPVIAKAEVTKLRGLRDQRGRREVCVNADPTTDDLGYCATHANVLRACPPLEKTQRTEWSKLRLKVATQFTEIRHHSGRAPTRVT